MGERRGWAMRCDYRSFLIVGCAVAINKNQHRRDLWPNPRPRKGPGPQVMLIHGSF